MLEIPDRFYLGDQEWRVFLLADWVEGKGSDVLGWTDETTLSIYVYDGNDSQRADTFIHEVLHALFHSIALWLPHDQEEMLVRRLTPALRDLLRKNPMFTKAALWQPLITMTDTHAPAPVLERGDLNEARIQRLLFGDDDEADDADTSARRARHHVGGEGGGPGTPGRAETES